MVIQRKRLACLMVVGICLLASGQAEPVSVFSTACVEGYPNLFLSFVFGFVEPFLPDMPSYLKNNKEAHIVVKPSKDFSSEYWFDDKGRLIKHRGVSDGRLYEDIIVYDEESRVQSVITTYKGDQFLCEKRLYTYDAHNKCSIKNEQGEVIYSIEGYQAIDVIKYLYTEGQEHGNMTYFFEQGHIQKQIDQLEDTIFEYNYYYDENRLIKYEWHSPSDLKNPQEFVRKTYYYDVAGNLTKVSYWDLRNNTELVTKFTTGDQGEWEKSINIYNGKEGGGIEREISYQ